MGTDIYMKWDGQTKEEEKAQYTGYSINAGSVGYLRASIGMETENSVLGEVFPLKTYWHIEEGKQEGEDEGGFIPYDFNQGWAVLQTVAKKYLASVLFGIPYKKNNLQVKHEEWVKNVSEWLSEKKKFDKVKIGTIDNDLPSAVLWLHSLFEFFYLGMEKQKKKLNPKIMISW